MIELTEEMQKAVNNALADKAPCLIATASAAGKPSTGYRGSMLAFTPSALAYWERTYRKGTGNVESNPHVVVLYRTRKPGRPGNSSARPRFIGTAPPATT